MLNCLKIIGKFYDPDSKACKILADHGARVSEKALRVAENLGLPSPDRDFVQEASMLHDIGMIHTDVPRLGCHGNHPYIAHGILGRLMLEKIGLPRHALVCERHIGVGISAGDVVMQKLPIPVRDMLPTTLEEKIVCYADKFFSKNGLAREKTPDEILRSLGRFGREKTDIFLSWLEDFEGIGFLNS